MRTELIPMIVNDWTWHLQWGSRSREARRGLLLTPVPKCAGPWAPLRGAAARGRLAGAYCFPRSPSARDRGHHCVGQPLAGGSQELIAFPGPQVRGTVGTTAWSSRSREARRGLLLSPVPRCAGPWAPLRGAAARGRLAGAYCLPRSPSARDRGHHCVGQPLAGGSQGFIAYPGPQVRGTGGTTAWGRCSREARRGLLLSPVPKCEGPGAPSSDQLDSSRGLVSARAQDSASTTQT